MKPELKPAWWKLEGIALSTIVALFLVGLAHLSPFVETISDIFVVSVAFWLMWRWCGANELALEAEDKRRQGEAEALLSEQTLPLNRRQLHFRRVMSQAAIKRKMV